MYEVLKSFRDADDQNDRNKTYRKGEMFPSPERDVGRNRLDTLQGMFYISRRKSVEAVEVVEEIEELEEIPNESWTKADIQVHLDNLQIGYNVRFTKAELLELLEG